MRCMVTGGGGFLGRSIAEMLANRGDKVRIFSRNTYPEMEKLGIESVAGDVRDLEAVSKACMGCDAVFHVAAIPGIWGDESVFRKINFGGTKNVLEACRRRGVEKMVYTSSPSVVFDMKDECGINESTPYPQKFFNPYSQSKAQAELLALQQNGRDGVLVCAIRPHLIYGPRDNHLIPRLLERARLQKLRIVGDGTNKVDLTYVDNAAFAHILACDAMNATRIAGRAYFISDDQPVVLWDWINTLLKELEIPPVTKKISQKNAVRVGKVMEKVYNLFRIKSEPRMTHFLAMALSCSHYYDLTNAKRDFRYAPPVKPEEALRRTVEYFKNLTHSPTSV